MSMPDAASDRIRLLSSWLAGTDIVLLELRTPGETIRLVRDAAGRGPQPEAVAEVPLVTVRSPGAGVFLLGHPSHAAPLVQPGQAMRAGDPVGLLQVGALLLHVAAPADGTVVGAVAADGSTVGYGAPLLHLRRSGEA